ncbi:hypothetical protein [Mycolicibacterium fortuitum]|uniref:hypothetical protein n=1 Tax=Mycolicibacterium fortuitum TaxID=1766 RepID=UPI0007E95979|nr:hypothetical protein [Mycolicibacterium fortuitum]MCA4751816.1 hypothetical protein [Mycolicibacterium fortuitum]NOQ99257.1 hypothetical protein [Mycolicibacterium fortuitum]OBB21472.1 hypothetical protein A5763_24040 [Mycolicibacterium fortuitum]OBG23089.1 hypothetical protein A5768_23285 [Mycolicibacterium fortuitum]TPW95291.1 hypothetical protein FKW78_11460 [Mycolicibacterium fortuitum]
MSFFGIPGYEPQWLVGRRTVARTHGRRLHAQVGRRLTRSWLVWNRTNDEWIADCPVLLDFEGEQVEITHQKVDDLSITWNVIDPGAPISYGEDPKDISLAWRDDACPRLAALHGQQLHTVELLVWSGSQTDFASDMVAVSFGFAHDRITISNGLDDNAIEFGPPDPAYRRHPLHNDVKGV